MYLKVLSAAAALILTAVCLAEPLPTVPPLSTAAPAETPSPTAIETEEPRNGTVTLTITCAGDCTLGGDAAKGTKGRFDRVAAKQGLDYFFQNFRSLFESDDITIVNLEGPLTDSTDEHKSSGYVFRGDPSYASILSGSSVELANLANNHALDYREQGLTDTKAALDAAGVYHCGFEEIAYFDVKGVRVGAVGLTKWESGKSEMVAAVQAARPNCDLLIVNVHWGTEKDFSHTSEQRAQAHAMIDAGADIVIGTHSHVYGGIELYNGRYILYSLGNFCFGGNSDPNNKSTMVFRQTFGIDLSSGSVTAGGISVIPARISGKNSGNDYQPYILAAKQGKALLEKIDAVSELDFKTANWLPDSYEVQNSIYG